MYSDFESIIKAAENMDIKKTVCIAGAGDEKILHLVGELIRRKMCGIILTGDEDVIRSKAEMQGLDVSGVQIIHEPDPLQIPLTAVKKVSDGTADVLVKGNLNTADFLKAVLNKEFGLRTGSKLSVLTAYDVPGQKKIFFLTDGGMIIAPSLEDKAALLKCSVDVLHKMGIQKPKVAILSANEKVSEKMPSTVDAAELCRMAQKGLLPEGIYEGPVAFDVAMRPDAAKTKGINSKVSGDVDLFLVPNIETGNCLGKAIGYFGGGETAGIVVGTLKPVVMSSRAASVQGKLTSVAWALLAG